MGKRRWTLDVERAKRKLEIRRRLVGVERRGAYEFFRSKVLDRFAPEYQIPIEREPRSVVRINIPRTFSFTENPEQTLETLYKIVYECRTSQKLRIVLDFRNVERLGLGADTVLGVLLKELDRESSNARTSVRGWQPHRPEVKNLMEEVGSMRVFMADREQDIRLSLNSTSKVFRHRDYFWAEIANPMVLDARSEVTKKFADHVNECLATVSRVLTDDGKDKLCRYLGEILDNAHEHSGLRDWVVAGYLDLKSASLMYQCVIVSFGKTAYDNFKELPPDALGWVSVQPFIESHANKGLFKSGPD